MYLCEFVVAFGLPFFEFLGLDALKCLQVAGQVDYGGACSEVILDVDGEALEGMETPCGEVVGVVALLVVD